MTAPDENESEQTQETFSPPGEPSRFRVFLPILGILAVVLIALLILKAQVAPKSATESVAVIEEGNVLPSFSLNPLAGESVPIETVTGKIRLINFWATWCEACMIEMPSIVSLRNRYHAKGLEVVSINVDENPTQILPGVIQKFKMSFPIFVDTNQKLSVLFDVHAIPLSVLIDKNLKILMVEAGERDWDDDDVHEMIERELALIP